MVDHVFKVFNKSRTCDEINPKLAAISPPAHQREATEDLEVPKC
jgi:hypothetical protein